jgi:MFS family permease
VLDAAGAAGLPVCYSRSVPPAPPAPPPASLAALVLFIAFACNLLGRGIADSFMVFVLPLSEAFGWKRAQVSSVYSAFLVVTGLAAPLTGMLIDRWGARVIYPLGVVLLGSACLLASTLTGLWQFQLVIGLMSGVAVSMLGMIPASMLISRWFRHRMSTAMGVAYAGFGSGTILIVPVVQRSIEAVGWRETYWTMGLATLAVLPLMLLVPWRKIAGSELGPPPSRGRHEGAGAQFRAALRSRPYWQIVTLFSFTSMTTFSVITQVVPFFVASGLTPLEAATLFGTAGLLSVFGIPVAGWAGDKVGPRATVTFTFVFTLLGIVALMALAHHPARWLAVAWVVCFGTMQGARGPIVSSLAARHFGGPGFATIYGSMFAWMSIAGAAGGLISALLYDVTGGYRAGLAFSMATVFVAASPFWLWKHTLAAPAKA